jgi:hypothetical protein
MIVTLEPIAIRQLVPVKIKKILYLLLSQKKLSKKKYNDCLSISKKIRIPIPKKSLKMIVIYHE